MTALEWLVLLLVSGLGALILGRHVKNVFGMLLGYGTCPNCSDSWLWKKSDSLAYYEMQEGKDYTVRTNIPSSQIISSRVSAMVTICADCLSKPARLNETRIAKDLKRNGWEEEKISLVTKAVIERKEKLNC